MQLWRHIQLHVWILPDNPLADLKRKGWSETNNARSFRFTADEDMMDSENVRLTGIKRFELWLCPWDFF